MRNAKRLLAALLLAAALIFPRHRAAADRNGKRSACRRVSEPQRDYTVQISKDTLRRTGSTSPPRRTGWAYKRHHK